MAQYIVRPERPGRGGDRYPIVVKAVAGRRRQGHARGDRRRRPAASHAAESRRGEVGNRGCSAQPFGGSHKSAENRAGSAAFTRTGLKTGNGGCQSPRARRRRARFALDSRVSRSGGRACPRRVAQPSTTYEPGDPALAVAGRPFQRPVRAAGADTRFRSGIVRPPPAFHGTTSLRLAAD